MRKLSPDLAQALAAEYVVGTLRGRARQRFEALVRADPEVARVLREWEAGLTPLVERVEPVEPPARVWRAIESQIGGSKRAESAGLWKILAMMSGAVATVLFAAFLWLSQGPRGEPLFVAVLNTPQAEPRTVVSMHSPDVLRVRVVRPWQEAQGKALEIWVLPKEGAPRSLGTVPNEAGDTIIRITSSDPRVRGAQSLAISLEPEGGSPTHQPSGPMVAQGPIAPVRKA